MGIRPWEMMLMMLETLLSLSRSTTRMRVVLTGILTAARSQPTSRQPRLKRIKKAFRDRPWATRSQ